VCEKKIVGMRQLAAKEGTPPFWLMSVLCRRLEIVSGTKDVTSPGEADVSDGDGVGGNRKLASAGADVVAAVAQGCGAAVAAVSSEKS